MVPAICLGPVNNEKQNPMTALVGGGTCPGNKGGMARKIFHSLPFKKPAAGGLPGDLRTFLKQIFH